MWPESGGYNVTGCGRRAEPLPVIKHKRVESGKGGGYNPKDEPVNYYIVHQVLNCHGMHQDPDCLIRHQVWTCYIVHQEPVTSCIIFKKSDVHWSLMTDFLPSFHAYFSPPPFSPPFFGGGGGRGRKGESHFSPSFWMYVMIKGRILMGAEEHSVVFSNQFKHLGAEGFEACSHCVCPHWYNCVSNPPDMRTMTMSLLVRLEIILCMSLAARKALLSGRLSTAPSCTEILLPGDRSMSLCTNKQTKCAGYLS